MGSNILAKLSKIVPRCLRESKNNYPEGEDSKYEKILKFESVIKIVINETPFKAKRVKSYFRSICVFVLIETKVYSLCL